MAKRKKADPSTKSVADYRFNDDNRLNIPPAALARWRYYANYDPHRLAEELKRL